MSSNILTREEKTLLTEAHVTVDGHKARIAGTHLEFAVVHNLETGASHEWSWTTVARIVANGGAFKS